MWDFKEQICLLENVVIYSEIASLVFDSFLYQCIVATVTEWFSISYAPTLIYWLVTRGDLLLCILLEQNEMENIKYLCVYICVCVCTDVPQFLYVRLKG